LSRCPLVLYLDPQALHNTGLSAGPLRQSEVCVKIMITRDLNLSMGERKKEIDPQLPMNFEIPKHTHTIYIYIKVKQKIFKLDKHGHY